MDSKKGVAVKNFFWAAALLLSINAQSEDVLKASVPQCNEILSQERAAYVRAAEDECAKARTYQEMTSNAGCLIRDRFRQCRSIRADSHPIRIDGSPAKVQNK
jgi:hypothetical protein